MLNTLSPHQARVGSTARHYLDLYLYLYLNLNLNLDLAPLSAC